MKTAFSFPFSSFLQKSDFVFALIVYHNGGSMSITNYDFCPKCGGKLEEVGIVNLESCIKCNTEINKKDKYCSSCGTENKKQKANRWLKEKECTSFNP